MTRNYTKYIQALIITLILSLVASSSNVSAHSASSCQSAGEIIGWRVHCSNSSNGHLGSNMGYYKFSSSITTKYKNYVSSGISRWHSTGIVSFGQSATSNNVISQHSNSNSSTVAFVQTDATIGNHKSRWKMSFNTAIMNGRTDEKNRGTATHELGHVIGLQDLKLIGNINKIMYGSSARTVTTPGTADKAGAKEGVK